MSGTTSIFQYKLRAIGLKPDLLKQLDVSPAVGTHIVEFSKRVDHGITSLSGSVHEFEPGHGTPAQWRCGGVNRACRKLSHRRREFHVRSSGFSATAMQATQRAARRVQGLALVQSRLSAVIPPGYATWMLALRPSMVLASTTMAWPILQIDPPYQLIFRGGSDSWIAPW